MKDDITLNSFPSNRVEALTMLYLQQQDLKDLSPEELTKKYFEVYKEVRQSILKKSSRDEDRYLQINLLELKLISLWNLSILLMFQVIPLLLTCWTIK